MGIRKAQVHPDVTAGLKRQGYGAEDVGKIMRGNLLRAWKAVMG